MSAQIITTSLLRAIKTPKYFQTVPVIVEVAEGVEVVPVASEITKVLNVDLGQVIPFINSFSMVIPTDFVGPLSNMQYVKRVHLDKTMYALEGPGGLPPLPVFGDPTRLLDEMMKGPLMVEANHGWIPTFEANKAINAYALHEKGIKGQGIKVWVLDTGVDQTNPQLQGVVAGAHSSTVGTPHDLNGHGTFCATEIVGQLYTEPFYKLTMMGVAPECELHTVKVLTDLGFGNTSDILAGMQMALNAGADVISMSLGGDGDPEEELDPFTIFIDKAAVEYPKTIIVVANGNSGSEGEKAGSTTGVPANCASALSVGCWSLVDSARSYFSSTGPTMQAKRVKPDIACVAEGSMIFGDRWVKPIEEVKVGDIVVAMENGQLTKTKVTGTMCKEDNDTVEIHARGVKLTTTEDHLIACLIREEVRENSSVLLTERGCERILARLEELKIAQHSAGRTMGIHQVSVSRILLRKRGIKLSLLERLVNGLNITLDQSEDYVPSLQLTVGGWKKPRKDYEYKMVWKEAGQLTAKDYIAVVHGIPEHMMGGIDPYPGYDEAFFRFLGAYIGDGYISKQEGKSMGIALAIPVTDPKRGYYTDLMRNIFGKCSEAGRWLHVHSMSSAKIVEGFHVGYSAKTKMMPLDFLQLPKEKLMALIEGYADADGHRTERDVGFGAASELLIKQLKAALDMLGEQTSAITHRIRDNKTSTRVSVETETWEFEWYHKFDTRGKGFAIDGAQPPERFPVPTGLTFRKVKSVKRHGKCRVFDVGVESLGHSFIANGVVVHNCPGGGRAMEKGYPKGQGDLYSGTAFASQLDPLDYMVNSFTCLKGTSMSCPMVAGCMALWKQLVPQLTTADCKAIFAKYGTPKTNELGWGLLDARWILQALGQA